jgi:hypothetical protein
MRKQINLLPKVPWLKRWFMTLLVLGLGVFAIMISGLGLWSIRLANTDQRLVDEVASAQARVALLRQQRVVDPSTITYQRVLKEVEALRENRFDWPEIIDRMREGLSEASRMNKALLKGGVVELENDFAELGAVASYLDYLGQQGLFEKVTIKSIRSIDLAAANTSMAPSSLSVTPSTVVPPPVNTGKKEREWTAEQLIESFQRDNPPAQDEAGALMNELNWLVTGQAFKDRFGVELPKPENADRKSPPPGSPFTEKEWQDALDEVEQLKKTRITSGSASGGANGTAKSEDQPVNVYRVVLLVSVKAPIIEKQG